MEQIIDDGLIEKRKESQKVKVVPIVLWVFTILIGAVFKVMHWPWGQAIIYLGGSGLVAYSINCLILLRGKKLFALILSILSILWFLSLLSGAVFNDGYPITIQEVVNCFFFFFFMVFVYRSIHLAKKWIGGKKV